MILISACLCGINCRYDSGSNKVENFEQLIKKGKAIPVCPEQLGGLPTPRLPSEIYMGSGSQVLNGNKSVYDMEGKDVTEPFIKGAEETLKLAEMIGSKAAVLKEGSPSCGSNTIYDGTFCEVKITDHGVTTAFLRNNGIEVYSEDNCSELVRKLLSSGKEKIYVGVIGASKCSWEAARLARQVGGLLAEEDVIILCGGRGGVMEEVSIGAQEKGGFVIGILPGESKLEANRAVNVSLASGIGDARNAVIAQASDALIAIEGGYGTLSEIALGLKLGKPVIGLKTWGIIKSDSRAAHIYYVNTPIEAVKAALESIK